MRPSVVKSLIECNSARCHHSRNRRRCKPPRASCGVLRIMAFSSRYDAETSVMGETEGVPLISKIMNNIHCASRRRSRTRSQSMPLISPERMPRIAMIRSWTPPSEAFAEKELRGGVDRRYRENCGYLGRPRLSLLPQQAGSSLRRPEEVLRAHPGRSREPGVRAPSGSATVLKR